MEQLLSNRMGDARTLSLPSTFLLALSCGLVAARDLRAKAREPRPDRRALYGSVLPRRRGRLRDGRFQLCRGRLTADRLHRPRSRRPGPPPLCPGIRSPIGL